MNDKKIIAQNTIVVDFAENALTILSWKTPHTTISVINEGFNFLFFGCSEKEKKNATPTQILQKQNSHNYMNVYDWIN